MEKNNQIAVRDKQALMLLTQTSLPDLLPKLVKDEFGTIDEEVAMTIVKKQVALTVSTAFESDSRIANLLRAGRREYVFVSLNNLLFLLNATLNVKEKLNTFQAVLISNKIMENFFTLTLEEVSKAFLKYASGDYGPTYNRIDVEGITNALCQYENSDEREHYMAYGRKPKTPEFVVEKGWYKMRKNRPVMILKLNALARELTKPKPPKAKTPPVIVNMVDDETMSVRYSRVIEFFSLVELRSMYKENKDLKREKCIKIVTNEIRRRYEQRDKEVEGLSSGT